MGRDRSPGPASIDRRALLRGALSGAAGSLLAACKGGGKASAPTETAPHPDGTCGPDSPTQLGDVSQAGDHGFAADPFGLGVASGDPLFDRVILWTRLVVEPTDVAATPADTVRLIWELSDTPDFAAIRQTGWVDATAELAHSVHVDVDGLAPDSEYWYRFVLDGYTSPVGRTRTLPCADALPEGFRIGLATCQRWSAGWYVSHRDLAAEAPDLVLFLGDYIYETGGGGVRDDAGAESTDLSTYRDRYGLYRSDPDLQAAHAAAPWMPIWDDHEVDNNHAGSHPHSGASAEEWVARRSAAYRAWYEHMPVRGPAPQGDALPIHRSVLVGDLAQIVLLDGRQYRDAQPCDDAFGPPCEEVHEDRSLLGAEQEAWFAEQIQSSDTIWTLIASPVVMLPMDFGGAFVNPDQWDGYPLARQRLLDVLTNSGSGEPVVVSGDIHASGVGYVPESPLDSESAPQVSEFVVPATTSGAGDDLAALGGLLAVQPHIDWWDFVQKGWVLLDVRRGRLRAHYRLADDVGDPASAVTEARVYEVRPGAPGPALISE